jgi:hypothetical protein
VKGGGKGGDLLYKEPRKFELRLTLTTGDVKQHRQNLIESIRKKSEWLCHHTKLREWDRKALNSSTPTAVFQMEGTTVTPYFKKNRSIF